MSNNAHNLSIDRTQLDSTNPNNTCKLQLDFYKCSHTLNKNHTPHSNLTIHTPNSNTHICKLVVITFNRIHNKMRKHYIVNQGRDTQSIIKKGVKNKVATVGLKSLIRF